MMRLIGGKFRGKRLGAIGFATRPTRDQAREMVFNLLAHNTLVRQVWGGVEGGVVLDGFAGTGSLGLEAFSRGARQVFFVENDPEAAFHLRHTLASFPAPAPEMLIPKTRIPETLTLWEISLAHIPEAPGPADLIFLDPPYHQGLLPPALVHLLKRRWIGPRTLVVMETMAEESLDLPEGLSVLLVKKAGKNLFTFATRSPV